MSLMRDGVPGPDPGFGVHPKSHPPGVVFLRALGEPAALLRELLGHGADVVRLEPAAPADVPDAHVVRLACEPVHVPARADPRL